MWNNNDNISHYYKRLHLKNKISCVAGGNLFIFNDYGEIQKFYVKKEKLPVQNDLSSVLFVKCSEIFLN